MFDTFMKEMKGMVVEDVVIEEEVEEGEATEKKEEVIKDKVEPLIEEDEVEKEQEEEEKKGEEIATLIARAPQPPSVDPTPPAGVTTSSHGKLKASKKRKTGSRK